MNFETTNQPLTDKFVVKNAKADSSTKAVKSVFIQLNQKNRVKVSKFRNILCFWFKYWPN